MIAIWKREFKSLFWSVTGWLFLGIVLALFGLYFFVYNLSYGYPYVSYSLSAISFIFVIAVPILTMRILSEDRKNKTDQLILTAPVSVGRIVLGKFLALASVYAIVIAVIAISPLVLLQFGEVPLAETYVGLLGFFLYGLACIAVGIFLSSLTENQVIAAVLTFVAIFVGYMMSSITGLISSSGNVLTKLLNAYNLMAPLEDFLNGSLSLVGVVYYLSLVALLLFLTGQVIQKQRWSVSRKTLSTSVFSVGMIAVVVALAVMANFIVREIPSKYTAVDVTAQKLYSVSSDTMEYLKQLDEDITIHVLNTKSKCDDTLSKTLQRYEEGSKHVTVDYVDVTRNPNFAAQYTEEALTANSLIVESAKRSRVVSYNDIYITEMDYSTYTTQVTGYDAEGLITSACQYVLSDDMPTVYQLTGHDELSISGGFMDALEKANFNVASLNLLEADEVPQDCRLLFVNGPVADLSGDDAEKLSAYMERGGSMFVTVDGYGVDVDEMPHFTTLLEKYGVEVAGGLVADNDAAYYYQNPFYLLPYVEVTEMTTEITGNTSVFMPFATGLRHDAFEDGSGGDILSSSGLAVAKTHYKTATTYEKEDGDIEGPFSLGCYVVTDGGGMLAVFGSAEMFTDNADSMVAGRNAKLFSGTVARMAGDDTEPASVVIPVKDYSVSQIMVSENTMIIYGLLWSILMPLALIIVGIVVWARRRKR